MKKKRRPKSKPGSKKCRTPGCRKYIPIKRADNTCSKCRHALRRENNPRGYFLNNLANRARQRGHDFTLTRKQFDEFCDKHNFMELKGKAAHNLSIDRIKGEHGYHHWNIQPLTLSENTRKEYVPYFQKKGFVPPPEDPKEFEPFVPPDFDWHEAKKEMPSDRAQFIECQKTLDASHWYPVSVAHYARQSHDLKFWRYRRTT